MRIASIDIGTNTVLLLIADIDQQGVIHPLEHQLRFPRLGREMDKNNSISISTFNRIALILNDYKSLASQFEVDKIVVCATSAVRDAQNKNEFILYLKKIVGINIEILSGEDEACLTYLGTISNIPNFTSYVVLDIGGGSTEISFQSHDRLIKYSLQLGSVRLTEHYLKHNPPTPEEIKSATQFITTEFDRLKGVNSRNYLLIGVAGTVTTLACLDQSLKEFDLDKVKGYQLNAETVNIWLTKLSSLKREEIRNLSNTTEGREDILTAGVLILYEFINQFQFDKIIVSERGLRYGLALREWERRLK